jgi:hypothetical protein
MKTILKCFLIFLGIFLCLAGCSRKAKSPPSKGDFMGSWKLSDPQGNIYYMTLDPDGRGETTRRDGELGKWEFKGDHIENTWNPKTIRLYFNSGQTQPLLNPTVVPEKTGSSIGVKVEAVPNP